MAAMVDRNLSTLNPNAPAFDPVGFREVEDFSPEWWELVTTSKWFRDFWLSFNSEYERGAGAGGEFSDVEEEFEEMIISSGEAEIGGGGSTVDTVTESDAARYLKVLLRMVDSKKGKLYRSSNVSIFSCSPKYNNQKKTSKYVNPNVSCRRNHEIYQPRRRNQEKFLERKKRKSFSFEITDD